MLAGGTTQDIHASAQPVRISCTCVLSSDIKHASARGAMHARCTHGAALMGPSRHSQGSFITVQTHKHFRSAFPTSRYD